MSAKRDYKYKVSIVTAVYNVEDYLGEMIESIIAQSLGLDNIQLILVDDGSSDGSAAICDDYAKKYPKSIASVHKNNGGVSSARNLGMEYVEGKYLNFCDSDDLLKKNALEKMYKYLEANAEYIDAVSIPMIFFGAKDEPHILNYKYETTKIVDLREEYNYIQLSMSSALVKTDALLNKRFNEKLKYAEDARVICEVFLDKMKYGVLSDTAYMYRKREGGGSAVDSGKFDRDYYVPCVKLFAEELFEISRSRMGYVPKFIQYTCLYYFQWRLTQNPMVPQNVISKEAEAEYKNLLRNIIREMDPEVIMEMKYLPDIHRLFLLALANDSKIKFVMQADHAFMTVDDSEPEDLSKYTVIFDCLECHDNEFVIEGRYKDFNYNGKITVFLRDIKNGEDYYGDSFERVDEAQYILDEKVTSTYEFRIAIPIAHNKHKARSFKVFYSMDGNAVECNSIYFGRFFPLANELAGSFYANDRIIFSYKGNKLLVSGNSAIRRIGKEIRYLCNLLLSRDKMVRRGFVARIIYHIFKCFKRKQIWLISDRLTKADDNGEALFCYLNEVEKPQRIETYFVIDNTSEDYSRIQRIGNVVDYNSLKYKMLALVADDIISAQADDYVFNRFFFYRFVYKDILYNQKRIFLQHGVTKDDLSRWLNKYNNNLDMIITVTNPEYKSFLTYNYFYDENHIKLTGFPRYDYLADSSEGKKIITIMPTWRRYLASGLNVRADSRILSSSFITSAYCNMYKQLLSSKRLADLAEKYGYTIQLMLHPTMPRECIDYFDCQKSIKVLDKCTRYRDIFSESRLVITDYSSVVFDFAYMRKPVLYYHADYEEFFSGKHSYEKGYFDYEKDGFGEISYSADELIDKIEEYIKDECMLKKLYLDRINDTFCFNDRNNCKRVYDAICELG